MSDRFFVQGMTLKVSELKRLEKDYPEGEYIVCSDDSADHEAREKILESLWAFRPEFISHWTDIPRKAIAILQQELSEGCNDTILAMLQAKDNVDRFINEAIAADGRGPFIASYDSEEIEYTTRSGKRVFLYRCN